MNGEPHLKIQEQQYLSTLFNLILLRRFGFLSGSGTTFLWFLFIVPTSKLSELMFILGCSTVLSFVLSHLDGSTFSSEASLLTIYLLLNESFSCVKEESDLIHILSYFDSEQILPVSVPLPPLPESIQEGSFFFHVFFKFIFSSF